MTPLSCVVKQYAANCAKFYVPGSIHAVMGAGKSLLHFVDSAWGFGYPKGLVRCCAWGL